MNFFFKLRFLFAYNIFFALNYIKYFYLIQIICIKLFTIIYSYLIAIIYTSIKKWYLMPPCLTLSIIRYGSRVKWSNPGKRVAPYPTH